MMRPRDPRVRQTINQISHNLESANETAQEGLYAFSHYYILPCLSSIGNCIHACTAPCLPSREDHLRRRRRGRAEASFDFYDDWDNDDANDSLLGWGTDELDRLLAGSGLTRGGAEQPRRQRKMSYGTRGPRRKSSVLVPDNRKDPTVIPSSSFLGFLERFPWRLGARGLKYRPSAADLQEHPHPTGLRRHVPEDEPLMESAEETEEQDSSSKNGRYRSATQTSRETATSLSSRGDLIPSDEEEDAVPLDDEFALAWVSRRGTGLDSDDQLSDKVAGMKRSMSGTFSFRTSASRESKKKKSRLRQSQSPNKEHTRDYGTASLVDLRKEEEQAELEEETNVARRRAAARRLAAGRGLDQSKDKPTPSSYPQSAPGVSDNPSTAPDHTHVESNEARTLSPTRGGVSRRATFPPLPFSLSVTGASEDLSTSPRTPTQVPSSASGAAGQLNSSHNHGDNASHGQSGED
ncbi:uncharacterized protein P174DRAFT_513466 [Aspergillus novofumigatus IBT 16806]|uniref:Uncharacterized protein n=1 Tax=Aspergillus novofumigatus (strain IBT 16806) TaxID=1392255 RepID=A0A2I1C5S1_ASPN1|nr:uncharacterized protein P174DRAFT_513466 [Aspergillus novofumigatus IBT 16806]PKX93008.1 hypothetical protein P174DRAFT_513466 [Aspergillus novofumigatus IBT 16806]